MKFTKASNKKVTGRTVISMTSRFIDATYESRGKDESWGRFGGGWDLELGVQVDRSKRNIIINLVTSSVRIKIKENPFGRGKANRHRGDGQVRPIQGANHGSPDKRRVLEHLLRVSKGGRGFLADLAKPRRVPWSYGPN